MTYWLMKWFAVLPFLLLCGVAVVVLTTLGFIGWCCAQAAGVCFGAAMGVVNAFDRYEHR